MLVACLLSLPAPAIAADDILIVTTPSITFYADTIAAMQAIAGESADPASIHVISGQELGSAAALEDRSPGLVISLGSKAASAVDQTTFEAPVIKALITEQRFIQSPHSPKVTALFLDQPLSRNMNLIRTAIPYAQRVGVLFGTELSANPISKLEEGASDVDLKLIVERVSDKGRLITQLDRLLRRIDVLLVTPDTNIYNRHTIKRILLTSYRQRIPLIGLSPGYVKAGALIAAHTTAGQYAAELMEMSRTILHHAGSPLPEPRHPGRFTVDTNARVAHSLSISLAHPHELEQALQAAERSSP